MERSDVTPEPGEQHIPQTRFQEFVFDRALSEEELDMRNYHVIVTDVSAALLRTDEYAKNYPDDNVKSLSEEEIRSPIGCLGVIRGPDNEIYFLMERENWHL